MVFDLEEFRVKEGRIIIDESFALETGLEAGTEQLLFRARPSGGSLTLDPGLLMELSGTVVIDSNGLHMTGAAEVETKGSVAFNGKRYDSDGKIGRASCRERGEGGGDEVSDTR